MISIVRHKTAISRNRLSAPVKQAVCDRLLDKSKSFFDYGCGKGDDIAYLQTNGYTALGWDPVHASSNTVKRTDIVNLGYVINVIEDLNERRETLIKAFDLAERVLIVSVLLDTDANRATCAVPHGDGIVTSRGTFQKFFTQTELKQYVKDTLEVEPVSAGLGIVYLFKDEVEKQLFLATRVRRQSFEHHTTPISLENRYKDAKEVLERYVDQIEYLGRLPLEEEFDDSSLLKEKLGSFNRAFQLVQHVFPDNAIEKRKEQRINDLLVYLALSRFQSRPPMQQLPKTLQIDMRSFFGSYSKACDQADKLLFLSGKAEAIERACNESKIGKILPSDLYIHKNYVDQLSPILRIYVGCAQILIGEVEEANIVKIHKHSGKVSYLIYSDFDKKAHPELQEAFVVMLRTLDIKKRNYRESENPPILHRKDTFVLPDYLGYKKFKKLTLAEENKELLSGKGIGFKQQWETHLDDNGFKIRGHQLVQKKAVVKDEALSA